MLVTQKQVLELYITVIECKTLYGLCIPHTAFSNATRLQLKKQQYKKKPKGPCYPDRNSDLTVNKISENESIGLEKSSHFGQPT